jgi:hypothetical protein
LAKKNPNFDEGLHRRLRELIEEVWDPRKISDGLVDPSLDKMQAWQEHLWPGQKDSARLRPAAAARLLEADARFKRNLGPAFDPATELDRIVPAIAEFVVDLRRIEPFARGQKGVECLAVHSCCKFAGCPPPLNAIGQEHWDEALRRGAKKRLPRKKRLGPLAEILTECLQEAAENDFANSLGSKRGRSYRARTERRRLISIRMCEILDPTR